MTATCRKFDTIANERPLVYVQAVLYNIDYEPVAKMVASFASSARASRIPIRIALGDASPEALFSNEDIDALAARSGIPVSYTFFDENTGFGKGHNLLARDADDDAYLLIINPDIVVSPSFLSALLEPFARDGATGIVEARQTPVEHPKAYDIETGETAWCSGACMMVPSCLFHALGGFDCESFWMYCEDVDLSWRVRNLGYKLIYQPAAVAFHPKPLSEKGRWDPTRTEKEFSARSELTFAYKWSNDKALRQLLQRNRKSGETRFAEATRAFEEKKRQRRLPERLRATDPALTYYEDGLFAHHRFEL